ncbi:MAG: DUF3563 family protein [Paracoccaceae bacterium]
MEKTMFRTMKKALRGFHLPSRFELEEAYLAGSANLYDLEVRQREIDAGKFASRF